MSDKRNHLPVLEPLESRCLMSASSISIDPAASIDIYGALSRTDRSQSYTFTASATGSMSAAMSAYGSNVNSYLSVYNGAGRLLTYNDNISRKNLNSAVAFSMTEGQQYTVVASCVGSIYGRFALKLASRPTDDYGNALGAASRITLSPQGAGSRSANINYNGDVDAFSVVAAISGTMTVDMKAASGSSLNSQLFAYNSAGSPLASNDNFGGLLDSQVSFAVTAGQVYYLKSAGVSGTKGGYALSIQTQAPAPGPAPDPTPGQTVTAQAVSIAGRLQLRIVGTDQADTITLSQSGGTFTLWTGAGSQNFTSSFTSLALYGFGGNDFLRVTNTVTIASLLYGGAGNDSLFDAGIAASRLEGGDGDDLLVSIGGGADTLLGGTGLDSFWADAADTISDASVTETAATAVHRVASFYQPYTNDPNSANYVSTTIAGQSLADPTASYGYRNFASSPLFASGGPQYNDARQGSLGDCYFIASVASLADTDPGLARQTIAPLGDGTYAVRFYRGGQAVYLRIDADLPTTAAGSLVYARKSGEGEIWVPLMEKAYAFFRYGQNSYSSLSGGWMATVYRELTNASSSSLSVSAGASQIFSYLQTQLSAGHAVTLGSTYSASGPIVSGHAYMVKSAFSSGGVNYVTVYNPWGVDGGTSTDSNPSDGLITLTVAQALQYFTGAVACQA